VTITDKDTSGRILVKGCFKNTNICNSWTIVPGTRAVTFFQPKDPLPREDEHVEIVEANYSQKPTQASSTDKQQGSGQVAQAPQAPKFVKLNYRNGSKVEIQVYTVDKISGKTVEKKNQITLGGGDSSQAMVDKDGNIDIVFSIVGKNNQGVSEYHCKPVKTNASSATSPFTLEFEKMPKC